MIRFALFVIVAGGLPTFCVIYAALARRTRLSRRDRIVFSTAVSLALVIGLTAIDTYTQRPLFLWLVFPGSILATATGFFLTLGIVTRRKMAARYRVALACLLAVSVMTAMNVATVDGVGDEVCAAVRGDHTSYASTYSAASFKRVQLGMTFQAVQQLLGKPLDEWTGDSPRQQYWRWTDSQDESRYYRRRVVRFLNGRVDQIYAHFGCDFQ